MFILFWIKERIGLLSRLAKESKGFSKIFFFAWVMLTGFLTFFYLLGGSDISLKDTVLAFLYLQLLLYASFLLPAFSFFLMQSSEKHSDKAYSSKSWVFTFLLALFGGPFGVHRFYVGRKWSGLVHLLSFGGLGISWIVDIILILSGNFIDKHGARVKMKTEQQRLDVPKRPTNLPSLAVTIIDNKQDTQSSNHCSEPLCSQADFSAVPVKKALFCSKQEDFSSGFCDILIPGKDEQKQAIPPNPEQDIFSFSGSINDFEIFLGDESVPILNQYTNGYEYKGAFFDDMEKYSDNIGEEAPFVPYTCRYIYYSAMNEGQKAWYFYWRSQLQKGNFPDTSLPYIYLHAYELFNGFGWDTACDGLRQLEQLFFQYNDRHSELRIWFYDWIVDFALLNHLDCRVLDDKCEAIPRNQGLIDYLIGMHKGSAPLRFSYPMILALCDYHPESNSFYRKGNASLMKQAIPRVISLIDAYFLKHSGVGLLETFVKETPKTQHHYTYAYIDNYAIRFRENIELQCIPYSSCRALRNYITQIVRYSENVLREIFEFRSRLRDVCVDSDIGALVEAFLKKEYAPNKYESKQKNVSIAFNFENIDILRHESAAVRTALEVSDELETQFVSSVDSGGNVPVFFTVCDNNPGNVYSEDSMQLNRNLVVDEESFFDTSVLSETMRNVFCDLSKFHIDALHAIVSQTDIQVSLEIIAEHAMSLPEFLLDEINDVAITYLDDVLIDTFGDIPQILEQYASELKNAIR